MKYLRENTEIPSEQNMNKAGRRTGKEPSFFPVHLLFFTRDAGPASVIRCCRADFINKNGKNCASGMITLY